jgi:predicted nicotinamide N-methyase
LVKGKRVLDFGAGGGVASLAAAAAGASPIVANDIDAWALSTVAIAAERQNLNVELLLGDLTTHPADIDNFDLILCSDLAYERRTAPKQRALLDRARRNGARVLVADAGRTYFTTEGLDELASFTLNVPRDLEGVDVRAARVFEMK